MSGALPMRSRAAALGAFDMSNKTKGPPYRNPGSLVFRLVDGGYKTIDPGGVAEIQERWNSCRVTLNTGEQFDVDHRIDDVASRLGGRSVKIIRNIREG